MRIRLDVELPCGVPIGGGEAVIRFLPPGREMPCGRYEVEMPGGDVYVFGYPCAHEEGVEANALSPVVRPVVEALLESGRAVRLPVAERPVGRIASGRAPWAMRVRKIAEASGDAYHVVAMSGRPRE